MKNIRVKFQSNSGDWCKGDIVGYSSPYEGRIDAIILVDAIRTNSNGVPSYVACEKFLDHEMISGCDIIER